jgi:UrcA family protein
LAAHQGIQFLQGGNMSLKLRIMLGTIAAATLVAIPAAYAADSSIDVGHGRAVVHLGDLNFDRPGDVAVMYERINTAAEQVCHRRALNGSYVISPSDENCVTDTVQRVVAGINRAPLTSFSQRRQTLRVASIAQR